MNIFALDNNPRVAAQLLCDKHVGKMGLEAVQMLSIAMEHHGLWREGMYKPAKTYKNHPCTRWVCQSWANFVWLCAHADECFKEHTERYGTFHKSSSILELILLHLKQFVAVSRETPLPHWRAHTPFAQVMPEKYYCKSGVAAYRKFYKHDKIRFAQWHKSVRPTWMPAPLSA